MGKFFQCVIEHFIHPGLIVGWQAGLIFSQLFVHQLALLFRDPIHHQFHRVTQVHNLEDSFHVFLGGRDVTRGLLGCID